MADISIIVPAYNESSRIIRCLESIKNQTYQDFIAYIVDDGSIDDTAEIIKSFIKDDGRFIYIFQNNAGQGEARNNALEKVETLYATFVDSDDYIEPNYLQKLIAPLKNGADISACYFTRVYPTKNSLNKFTINDLMLAKFPAPWGKAFKTGLIKGNGIKFPNNKLYYEDLGFYTMLIAHTNRFAIIEESLYNYLQNEGSTMYTYNDKIFDIYKIFDIVEKNIGNSIKLEYIEIYHILIGTIYRASFRQGFDYKQLKEIYDRFSTKFPSWYKNIYIKSQMPLFYRIYLFCLRSHLFAVTAFILKKLNKYVAL